MNYEQAERLTHSFIPRTDMLGKVEYGDGQTDTDNPYVYIAESLWDKEEVPSYYNRGESVEYDLSDVGLNNIQKRRKTIRDLKAKNKQVKQLRIDASIID